MSLAVKPLALEIQKICIQRELTLALAESCTGGALSAELARIPGASKYFIGSVVSYHRSIKNQILGVPLSTLQVMGEVSTPVAKLMALGVKKSFAVDWAVAITGVAGPTGGSIEKPVGTVCFAVVGPGYEHVEIINFGQRERHVIQNISVDHALSALYTAICPIGLV